MKKLPIGIQTFSRIIADGFIYIDKTLAIFQLSEGSGRYLLSRPRRFGKSLLVDTLKELFEGNQLLFQGLYIEDKWDWQTRWPVLRFDFADGPFSSVQALESELRCQLQLQMAYHGVECEAESVSALFRALIRAVEQKYQQRVVILVDEYDKPILDNIETPDLAARMREVMKGFYSVLKSQDACIRFVFLTGVSKFSWVSLFSGLNQLEDITLDHRYSTICGYTGQNLQVDFAEHLQGVDWQKLKRWYNGYQFDGEAVYNPYDILLFISKGQRFRSYWFETGSPSFLLRLTAVRLNINQFH